MGRVRQAYGLNGNEVEKAIGTLWPCDVFPLELWRRTYERFWRSFANSNPAIYGIESPALPEVDTAQKYFLITHEVQPVYNESEIDYTL